MTSVAHRLPQLSRRLDWLAAFLSEELRPYPGRTATVARMVFAATLVMIICMTFRLPCAFQGAIYALMVSRENLRATFGSAATILAFSVIGTIYLLGSAWFVVGSPPLQPSSEPSTHPRRRWRRNRMATAFPHSWRCIGGSTA